MGWHGRTKQNDCSFSGTGQSCGGVTGAMTSREAGKSNNGAFVARMCVQVFQRVEWNRRSNTMYMRTARQEKRSIHAQGWSDALAVTAYDGARLVCLH